MNTITKTPAAHVPCGHEPRTGHYHPDRRLRFDRTATHVDESTHRLTSAPTRRSAGSPIRPVSPYHCSTRTSGRRSRKK